jgi:uncharacterized membrane protein YgcG
MKELIFFIICLLLCITVFSTHAPWTAEELDEYFTKQNYPSFVDPEGYVQSEEIIREIKKTIESIYFEKKYETKVFIISEMSTKYKHYYSKDISLFMNDLTYLIFKGDKTLDADSCFILFSINDKLMRIRTGENANYYISDLLSEKYLNSIKSEMRSKDYGAAAKKLVDEILDRVINGNPQFERILAWIIIIIIVIAGCIIFIFSSIVQNRKYYLTPTAQERLLKIKVLSEENRTNKDIVQTTCVICLEDLKSSDYVGNSSVGDKTVSLCEISTLECGHSFHTSCIATWMDKSNKCPTCRHQIDEEGNSRRIAEGLVLVQTAYHPNLANYTFNHTNGFIWHRTVTSSRGNHGGSSYSGGWGLSGGGATSSW